MAKKKMLTYRWLHLLWFFPIGFLVVCTMLIVFLPEPRYANGFQTLDGIQKYAATLDESIEMENDNVFYPSYDEYYKMHKTPTRLKSYREKLRFVFSKLGLINPPMFSMSFLESILTDVTQDRLSKKLISPFIQTVSCTRDSKFIIIGELFGAFHSLTRNLVELKRLNLIDNNLKLVNQKTFLVFLGETVARSPFGTETLALLLRLIRNNPDNVIHLRGRHEHASVWRKQSLKQELALQAKKLPKGQILLADKVDDFFQTLPYAFYLTMPLFHEKQYISAVRIMPNIDSEQIRSLVSEKILSNFLEQANEHIHQISLNNLTSNVSTNSKIKLVGMISAVSKKDEYEKTMGLNLLAPKEGVIRWTVLSCPIHLARKALHFFYDAFAIFYPLDNFDSWKIVLHNRDTRCSSNIYNTQSFNFFASSANSKIEHSKKA